MRVAAFNGSLSSTSDALLHRIRHKQSVFPHSLRIYSFACRLKKVKKIKSNARAPRWAPVRVKFIDRSYQASKVYFSSVVRGDLRVEKNKKKVWNADHEHCLYGCVCMWWKISLNSLLFCFLSATRFSIGSTITKKNKKKNVVFRQ